MKNHSAIKKKEIPSFAANGMEIESITFSEIIKT
jgi:hypothetical protein